MPQIYSGVPKMSPRQSQLWYLNALNLDKKNVQMFSGPQGSYFGFSFDIYQAADKRMNVVVGAPRLNSSLANGMNGGGVFLCPWGSNVTACSRIPFDKTGDRSEVDERGIMTVHKSNQWLGATVRIRKSSIVACAPFQEYNFSIQKNQTDQSGKTPTGACYYTEDMENFYEFAPCRSTDGESSIPDNRFCEAGFSADISEDGDLLVGAPGGNYFQGLYFEIPLSDIPEESGKTIQNFGDLKRLNDRINFNATKGFAVAYGEFSNDRNPDIILGCPTLDHKGSVEIYSDTRIIINITGSQVASYFGHTVAAIDVNGDGFDDLLVGAPMFMEHKTGGKLQEVGRVYVYMQKRPRSVEKNHLIISGTHVYGQFGASISTLGDLDQDGYNDVAVGSPFGGQSGAGCVFIYRGEKSGLATKPSQILDSPLQPPSRFGFALRGGEDIDQNGYPDLIVGAFEADTVYVFRAQPVMHLQTSLTFTPDSLNPDLKLCNHPDAGYVTCFSVDVCVRAWGKSLPKSLSLLADIQLDIQKNRFLRRTLFSDSSLPSKNLVMDIPSNSQLICSNVTAYLRNENEFKDKLSPIVVSVSIGLNTAQQPSNVLPPLIQGNAFLQEQIHILLDCGEDNICVPDLHLRANWSENPLIIGVDNLVQVHFDAINRGEGAFETELHVLLPDGAHFVQVLETAEEKILCSPKKVNDTELVVCELGNPLKNGTHIHGGLQLSISNLEDSDGNLSFPMEIKSRNSLNGSSPALQVHFRVTAKVLVVLLGNSHPSEVVLPLPNWNPNEESNKPLDRGEKVTHVYELHNAGPGTVDLKLVVQSPDSYEGEFFLYPLQLRTDEDLLCSNNSILNVLQLDTAEPAEQPANISKGGDVHRMHKREVGREEAEDGNSETDNSTTARDGPPRKQLITLSCNKSPCWEIECFIKNLEKGERVKLTLDSILWISSFMKRPLQPFTLQSRGYYEMTGVPYKVQPPALLSAQAYADTVVQWVTPDGQKEIPLWWIILGVIGGLLILSLLVFIMWKLGFFQRTRPPSDDQDSG
ncbi:integrin alpha-IIb-like [Hyperolius riggenbachi]|uniref:integrin alpha-IIb-like n=1 Tax=Hyperolius riggenbachi TaxID=752182 RepID=UPI0035A3782C